MKKKILIFHPALAPYRIDQFNLLSKIYELKVVFLLDNIDDNKFDQSRLLDELEFPHEFLLNGISLNGRLIRWGIYSSIRKYNPDVIIASEFSFTTQLLLFFKRTGLIRQRIGSVIDDSIQICETGRSRLRYHIRNQTVKYLDFLVLFTDEVADFYKNEFDLQSENIIVSPIFQLERRLKRNPDLLLKHALLNVKKYKLENKKVLLFVGRLASEKGLLFFLKNTKDIIISDKDLLIVIVGDGTEYESIQTFVNQNDLHGKIIMTGRLEGDSLNSWYVCATGFFLPSFYEVYGAVVDEALTFGLKILCSKYAGIASNLKEENGIIFDPLQPKEVFSKFQEFIANIDSIGELDINKRKSASIFSNLKFEKEWLKLNSHD